MGLYDHISDAKLRFEVQRFARILQRMEEKNEVLDRTADILTLLGELRRMVFAWEVRSTYREEDPSETVSEEMGGDSDAGSPTAAESDSERIVREAREQLSDFLGGLDADAEGPGEPPSLPDPDPDGPVE